MAAGSIAPERAPFPPQPAGAAVGAAVAAAFSAAGREPQPVNVVGILLHLVVHGLDLRLHANP